MPPKNKPKNAPNQHDKRHESGLAPPGKRVTKKHSNGHLNGQPNGKPVSPGHSPAAPTSGINYDSSLQATAREHATQLEGTERDRTCSDASLEERGQCGGDMADVHGDHASQMNADEVGNAAPKPTAPNHVGSTYSTISTILAYYPLRDAISILILLLSLPPTLVLVIQTLFASLTFVPPTTSISFSTLPNIKEMFNSANLGYPALATILIVDFVFWLCWLPLWKPVQVILLDLSQAVIAVSLSGAAASTGGPTYSIATCTTIVCVVHVLRYKAIHLTALDYLRSVLHKADIGFQLDVPSFAANFTSSPPIDRGWLYTVFRTILGIHIVSQGVTTCIRRSLVKANEQSTNIPAITKTDPEATAGTELNSRPSTGLVEGTQHTASVSSTDGRPPGPSPAYRDTKTRESNTKKKRKQANQVRSQQPLWAAIASTKVTFVKEMEQRDAFGDAREAARMDTTANTTNTATSNTNQPVDRIWISDVRDTEIFFGAEIFSHASKERADGANEDVTLSSAIDQSNPVYVRVNGAAWSSTRIRQGTNKQDNFNGSSGDCYQGEIFGLAPLSTYQCQIVSMSDHSILCSTSIITQAAPTPEQASSQPTHQALRPSSPITTLKQSIQTAEAKLNETRNRTKKTRKDQRAVQADIKREINILKSKLDSSGGSDDKQEKRLAQINQHKAQAEEAATELKQKIDEIGEIPAKELTQSDATKSKWQSATNAKRDANKDLENIKSEAERDANALKSEIVQTESKREKLAARLQSKTEEYDNAVEKQKKDMSEKEKRDFERMQVRQKREKEEADARALIAQLEDEAEMQLSRTQEAYQQIANMQSWSQQPPPYDSQPPTPETAQAGAAVSFASPSQANGFPAFGLQQFQSPFQQTQPSIANPQGGPRGRSSSMLSQYSGFTDNGEEYSFAPEMPRAQMTWPLQHPGMNGGPVFMDDRKESEGSGSGSQNNGSTGSNSPRPDAKVFVPGKAPGAIGTIGPPGKKSPVASPGAIGSGR